MKAVQWATPMMGTDSSFVVGRCCHAVAITGEGDVKKRMRPGVLKTAGVNCQALKDQKVVTKEKRFCNSCPKNVVEGALFN